MTQLPSVDLRGLRALVTGGATGIGLAITKALMAHGAGVHACGTKADALDSAKAALPGLGVSVADITQETQVRQLFADIEQLGEQRTSNFLIWQSAYAEMVFMDVLWPDVNRETLWKAIEIYADRDRRFGKA